LLEFIAGKLILLTLLELVFTLPLTAQMTLRQRIEGLEFAMLLLPFMAPVFPAFFAALYLSSLLTDGDLDFSEKQLKIPERVTCMPSFVVCNNFAR